MSEEEETNIMTQIIAKEVKELQLLRDLRVGRGGGMGLLRDLRAVRGEIEKLRRKLEK